VRITFSFKRTGLTFLLKNGVLNDIDADPGQLGLSGSPTKVKKIENVVFTGREAVELSGIR
jgi:hypothetical protein